MRDSFASHAASLAFACALLASVSPSQVGGRTATSPVERVGTTPDGITIARHDHAVAILSNEWAPTPEVVWRPDGSAAFAGIRADGKFVTVVVTREGAQVGKPHDWARPPILAGSQFVFHVADVIGEHKERHQLQVDGKRIGGKEDWIGDLAVSTDGSTLAFWTEPGARPGKQGSGKPVHLTVGRARDGRWRFRRGRTKCKDNGGEAPSLSADGSRIAAAGVDREGWRVLHRMGKKERLSEPMDAIVAVEVAKGGSHTAWLGAGGPMLRDAKPFWPRRIAELPAPGLRELGRGTRELLLSPDGQHVVCVYAVGAGMGLAIDGVPVPSEQPWAFVGPLAFSPDGDRLAFGVRGAKDETVRLQIGTLTDERAKPWKAERVVATEGLEVRALFWSGAGALAYQARDANGWFIGLADGGRSESRDLVGRPFFQDDGSVRHGAVEATALLWVRCDTR